MAPVIREPALHREIAQVLRLEVAAPGYITSDGVVWWSVDIAAYAGVAPGLRTARGVIAGIPDVIIFWAGRAFFVELKALDGLFLRLSERSGTVSCLRTAAMRSHDRRLSYWPC